MTTSEASRAFLLRPDISLRLDGGVVSVLVEGDAAGELTLAGEEIALLQDLLEVGTGVSDEAALLRSLQHRGHGVALTSALLDTLLESGLAVRYTADISPDKASRIGSWTSQVDAIATRLQTSRVVLISKDTEGWSHLYDALSGWGIPVAIEDSFVPSHYGAKDGLQPSPSLIVATDLIAHELQSLCRWCDRQRVPLLPVRKVGDGTVVGPIFIQDVSPCPFCAALPDTFAPLIDGRVTNQELPSLWDFVTQLVVDCLARRPGAEALFLRHRIGEDGGLLESVPAYRDPRCPECSRLNRYPENAVING